MTKTQIIIIVVVALVILGVIILPLFNRSQFKKLPIEQKIRIIMKQANKLVYFKNISSGRNGYLCYVKNKRKILIYPWVINEKGEMEITKKNPFDRWDYPEKNEKLSSEEVSQAREELKKYSKKSPVRIVWYDEFESNQTEEKPD